MNIFINVQNTCMLWSCPLKTEEDSHCWTLCRWQQEQSILPVQNPFVLHLLFLFIFIITVNSASSLCRGLIILRCWY